VKENPKTICEVYTDGACRGNPGIGGWGALIIDNDSHTEIKGFELHTTNNRMELMAVIKSLEHIGIDREMVIFTDSQYVQKGITEWVSKWKTNLWRTASKKPVKNVDLWQWLDELTKARSIDWKWVKGHAGIEGNEIADSLANAAIDNHLEIPD